MSKERIIAEIRRTAEDNGGAALGQERFAETTGIGIGVWRGKYWRTWSEALREAGFSPNRPNEAHSRDSLLTCLARLALEHRRFPTYTDLRMAKQADAAFPTHHAFNNLGDRHARIRLLRTYATEHAEYHDVLGVLPPGDDDGTDATGNGTLVDGAVYMLKLGKHYKVGKSFRVPQRHQEIAIELPEKPEVVHVIATDDPTGIESYWHKRFAAKRTNGEWFALTREDLRAFKRRKFM
jgi:hypothetical protein